MIAPVHTPREKDPAGSVVGVIRPSLVVRVAGPLKVSTVWSPASWAVITALKPKPAVAVGGTAMAKWSNGPPVTVIVPVASVMEAEAWACTLPRPVVVAWKVVVGPTVGDTVPIPPLTDQVTAWPAIRLLLAS